MTDKTKHSIEFERNDNRAVRLPAKTVMASWIEEAATVPLNLVIRFVDEEEGRELNRYRRPLYEKAGKKDYATNVLTFDYAHEPVAEADIVICTSVVVREAKEQGKTFREHLAHLLVHAALHAQGYDHQTDIEAERMEAVETFIMKRLGFDDPYFDRARAH